MNYITRFLEHTEDLESPTSYIKWCALATLAAVLRNNVYFQYKHDRVYPNIYVLIIASSSATRKDPPVRVAEKLIRVISNTKVISGRTSIQAAMRTLGEHYTNDKGIRLKDACGILISKELADLLVDDPVATKVLTDWYDCHEVWDNNLVSSNISKLENVCVTLLAASNDELFKEVYKHNEIYGGLLARTFIVTESKRRRKNSRMYDFADTKNFLQELIEHLFKLSHVRGEIQFTEEARKYYDEWYNSIEDEKFDKAGIVARIHTGIIKVAILLAAAKEKFELVVTIKDVEDAIDLCTGLLKNYKQIVFQGGRSEIANPTNLVLAELVRAPEYTLRRRALIQQLFGNVEIELLDKVIDNAYAAGFVQITQKGNEPAYQLTEKFVNLFTQEYGGLKKRKTVKLGE